MAIRCLTQGGNTVVARMAAVPANTVSLGTWDNALTKGALSEKKKA